MYNNLHKNRIISIFLSPYLLSSVISIVIIFSFPNNFNKYEVSLEDKHSSFQESYFEDLDNDGNSEELRLYDTFYCVLSKGKFQEVRYFEGEIQYLDQIHFGDIDNDGIKEILFFTHKEGFVYIHCFNSFSKKAIFENRRVCKCNYYNDHEPDYTINYCGLYDCNNDGINEVYFSIFSGFTSEPNSMFSYDSKSDTMYSSPEVPHVMFSMKAFDFDNDSVPEFYTDSFASGGPDDSAQVDYSAWLMVVTPEMKYKFDPIKYGSTTSIIDVVPYQTKDETYIAVMHLYKGDKDIESFIALYDIEGKLVKKKSVVYDENMTFAHLGSNYNGFYHKLFLVDSNRAIKELNSDLEIISEKQINDAVAQVSSLPMKADIDLDGIAENLFWTKRYERLVITRNDFSNPVYLNFDEHIKNLNYSIIEKKDISPMLYVQGEKYSYYFQYKKNLLYAFKYPIYIGIYGIVLLLLLALSWLQKYRLKQRYIAEKKISELQLSSTRNRLNPHFTLNLLNSIGTLIYNNDKKKADYIFAKYAALLRNMILSSDNITTSLKLELEMVANYLELEKFRLNYNFDYKIIIDEKVDTEIKIPKTQIYTFIENAIKHGISNLDGNGEIIISAKNMENKCFIDISDNGIGREKAKSISTYSTGKGLTILDEILLHYYQVEKTQITYEISDIFDNKNKQGGTKVQICVPLN